MIWANKDAQRIKATPKAVALCPICNKEVISKCGSIKIWHWSHKSVIDCDNWAESETEWHFNWQDLFPKEQQEVVIKPHRADIQTKSGMIIELQNSPLSSDSIKEREKFYNNMCWLINGEKLTKGLNIFWSHKNNQYEFLWLHPSKIWLGAKKKVFIDRGNNKIFLMTKFWGFKYVRGTGIYFEKEEFLKLYGDVYGTP